MFKSPAPTIKPILFATLLLAALFGGQKLFGVSSVAAQERIGQVQVRVTTDRADWTYAPGQPVSFRITAVQDGHPLQGVQVRYRVGPEMLPPTLEKTQALTGEGITVNGGTMNEPGFLRCVATVEMNGKTYRGLATAGFKPEAIGPTIDDPPDFDAFWTAGKRELAELPIDAKLTLLPDYSTPSVNVYHVSLQNVGAKGEPPAGFMEYSANRKAKESFRRCSACRGPASAPTVD